MAKAGGNWMERLAPWRGILPSHEPRTRLTAFAMLLLVGVAICFTPAGVVSFDPGLGGDGVHACLAIALVVMTALMLGCSLHWWWARVWDSRCCCAPVICPATTS